MRTQYNILEDTRMRSQYNVLDGGAQNLLLKTTGMSRDDPKPDIHILVDLDNVW